MEGITFPVYTPVWDVSAGTEWNGIHNIAYSKKLLGELERLIDIPKLFIQFNIFLKYLKCKEDKRDTNTQRERERERESYKLENSNNICFQWHWKVLPNVPLVSSNVIKKIMTLVLMKVTLVNSMWPRKKKEKIT